MSGQDTDQAPRKRIARPEHLTAFLASPALQDLEGFLDALNDAAQGKDVVRASEYAGSCEGVKGALRLLDGACSKFAEFPPLEQASRFGNAAFRSWLESVKASSAQDVARVAPDHAQEIAGYWWNSFGNMTRLDYGTGHEASFVVFLMALSKAGVLEDIEGAALCVFPRYLDVVYEAQSRYRLEPAGSHGVWSLDDYHMLPFLLGSSQLCQTHGRSIAGTPKSLRNGDVVEALQAKNLFMRAIKRISDLKTGPFQEHSPLLADIGALVRSWKEVNEGMHRMYRAEVLGKFPVAQHFLFGQLFPCTWELSEADLEALDHPQVAGQGQPAMARSPFAMAAQARGGGDALVNYFKVSRKPIAGAGAKGASPRLVAGASCSPSAPAAIASSAVPHELVGDSGIRIGGWEITTSKTRISSDAEIDELKEAHRFNGFELDFPLPEMMFGRNFARFEHRSSGTVIEFNALDAACCCKISRDAAGEPDRVLFKLPNAEKWANRKDYNGEEIKSWRDDYDWTFTSTYGGSFISLAERAEGKPNRPPQVRASAEGLDYELLKRRDPILYFDSLVLFEDDLFDNGESKLTVKVRVMPTCFFALQRMWLRVDNVYVRCIDTRLFHAFGSKNVVLETVRKEASADALRGKGQQDLRVMMDEERVLELLDVVEKRVEEVVF